MQEFINFIVNNWQFVSSIAISVFGFILLLLRKRYKIVDSALEYLSSIVTDAVRYAENPMFAGNKKAVAMDFLKERFLKHFPGLKWKIYESSADFMIEDVLNTPQKKGGN